MTKSIEDDFLNGVRKNNIYSDNTKNNIERFYKSMSSFTGLSVKELYLLSIVCNKVTLLPNGLISLSLNISSESLPTKIFTPSFYRSFNVIVVEDKELEIIREIKFRDFQTTIEWVDKKYSEIVNHKKPYEMYKADDTGEEYYKFVLTDDSIRFFPKDKVQIK